MVLAAAGPVTRSFATPLGGVTVYLDVELGSVSEESLVIKNVDPELHEDAGGIVEGAEVAAVGLVADDRGAGYWLGPSGAFAATVKNEVGRAGTDGL